MTRLTQHLLSSARQIRNLKCLYGDELIDTAMFRAYISPVRFDFWVTTLAHGQRRGCLAPGY